MVGNRGAVMQILSVFWGKAHADMFIDACVRSLLQTKNKQALSGGTWNIYCSVDDASRVSSLILSQFKDTKLNIQSVTTLRRYTDPIQCAFVKTIESCLTSGERLLLAPPDTIFSDGSITNMIKVGYQKGSCVFVPHPRVLNTILEDINSAEVFNSLPKYAFKHLHRSWVDAEIGHPHHNSFIGGVAWQRLTESLVTVSHLLPTPYLMDFTPDDLSYFKTCTSFGNIDHTWAIELIKQQRQRTITSSDVAFVCEITDKDKNIPPYNPNNPTDGSFWANHEHNRANKQVISTFKLG